MNGTTTFYAAVAGLVFNQVMFGPLEGGVASIVSFASVGLSFLFRPLGAFLAGHFGDRLGRRLVLMVTLFAMGGATTLIGLLPTYDTAGVWAPILLIFLRIIQGISAGESGVPRYCLLLSTLPTISAASSALGHRLESPSAC